MSFNFGLWDILLLLVTPIHATCAAYLHKPRHKALVLNFPIPFTLAYLALGKRADATNVTGVLLLVVFVYSVYALHSRLRINIIISIVVGTLGYCAAAAVMARQLPTTDGPFWVAVAVATAVGAWLYLNTQHRDEPGHRSPLPIWIKFPVVMLVVLCLVALKSQLSGFMTVFPMVTVITTYEARRSLWMLCRQTPVIVLSMTSMLVIIRLVEPGQGVAVALALGWIAGAAVAILLTRRMWRGMREVSPS